ncbi:uncharacterized protein LY89DRAFT_681717 [Mollisia scopiformis]|uniref:Uncharacterized protein n=1 Tax=Mollisia scopiformis TaxID=149040 RepID=A0A194XLZ4_MOLSC|nr:uncharacterized protein LY89DRAFT_681717 [Mollisia scopiformis]KUJ21104.1 hypothetical protein LY89DRAFT_681717 [Mollisia scopiformis]
MKMVKRAAPFSLPSTPFLFCPIADEALVQYSTPRHDKHVQKKNQQPLSDNQNKRNPPMTSALPFHELDTSAQCPIFPPVQRMAAQVPSHGVTVTSASASRAFSFCFPSFDR